MDAHDGWGPYRTAGTSPAPSLLEEGRAHRFPVLATLTIAAAVAVILALPFILYSCGAFDPAEGALAVVPR